MNFQQAYELMNNTDKKFTSKMLIANGLKYVYITKGTSKKALLDNGKDIREEFNICDIVEVEWEEYIEEKKSNLQRARDDGKPYANKVMYHEAFLKEDVLPLLKHYLKNVDLKTPTYRETANLIKEIEGE